MKHSRLLAFAYLFGLGGGRRRKRKDKGPSHLDGLPSEEEKSNTQSAAAENAAWRAGGGK
jgi:hypothetical protein